MKTEKEIRVKLQEANENLKRIESEIGNEENNNLRKSLSEMTTVELHSVIKLAEEYTTWNSIVDSLNWVLNN